MKQDNSRAYTILALFGILPVIWLALLIAPSLAGGLPEIIKAFPAAMDNPFHAEQYADDRESVEDTVLRRIGAQQLHTALAKLTEEERQLIDALYFREQTEAAAAVALGISQQAVHKRKNKILKKLKLFLEN